MDYNKIIAETQEILKKRMSEFNAKAAAVTADVTSDNLFHSMFDDLFRGIREVKGEH